MTMVRELLRSGRPIKKSDCSVNIVKLTSKVQQLTGLVESKYLELQTMPGLLEAASR